MAKKLHITGATVCKWRGRFRVKRLEGLLDEPRPGAPRSITDAQVEDVITGTLESIPENSTHWSTRLMARQSHDYERHGVTSLFAALNDPKPFVWTADADLILCKVERLCKRISNSGD